jgi:hypothetical protein
MNRRINMQQKGNSAGGFHPAGLWFIAAITILNVLPSPPAHAGDGTGSGDLSGLHSLRLIPENINLSGAGASQQIAVMGTFADGFMRDLTARSSLSLSNTGLAVISDSGRIEGIAAGQLELRAVVGDQSVAAIVHVESSNDHRPFSFARDIGGILTSRGCNSAECHGSVMGMGGFKLSMNGFFPRTDYHWIVEGGKYDVLTDDNYEPWEHRINLEQPEESLLLLKPTRSIPHEGGRRFKVGSAEYQAILDWIRNGAPYGEEDENRIKNTRIEIQPAEVVLEPAGRQQLVVTTQAPDDSREDMTHRVLYNSKNTDVARVSDRGIIRAVGPGETWVILRAAGQLSSVHIQVIPEPEAKAAGDPVPAKSPVDEKNFIDEFVFAKLKKLKIEPSGLCTDEEFLRRVCLDVTGTLPPPHKVRKFLDNPDPEKRDQLIDILLESPQYVDFWTYRFSDLFRVYFGTQTNMEFLHMYQEWVRHCIAENKPYDQIARERVAASGYGGPILHYYHHAALRPPEQVMLEQVKLFQGLRLDCAQCHDHPTEPWSQDQFWGLTAFFGKMTQLRQPPDNHKTLLLDLPVGLAGLENREPMKHPRTEDDVEPVFLDGGRVPEDDRRDLRMKLARWITSPENPYFAKAAVNRFWAYFFGRGIINPIDDLRPSNPPTHPELLETLAQDFKNSGYDLKHLIRTIVQSGTYQRSVEPTDTNLKDTVNYSRFHPRPLEAPVLLDAISKVTGTDEKFEMYAGGLGHKGPAPQGTRALGVIPDLCPSRFLDVYGRSNRQALPEYDDETTIQQALHILAGSTYNDKISHPAGRLARLLAGQATDRDIVDELYLATLCRFPTEREWDDLEQLIRHGPSRNTSMEAFTWALVSSREFAYNH